MPFALGKVAAVLDCSYSSSGSSEKRQRPLGVALAVHYLLQAAAQNYQAFWSIPLADPVQVVPRGQTDLATPLLAALEWQPDIVLIVSDGWENDPPNGAAEVIRVFRQLSYISYVPHGLVLSWSEDGSPVAAMGGQLMTEGKRLACGATSVRLMHRMAKRESENRLRFLPLHLSMEGFLSLFFNGPTVAWSEYSRQALAQGLSPRVEWSIVGRAIAGLEEALRVFEIHERQVGMLLFVSEALASAFVVPTPEDYRVLHTSLLEDFYGELLYHYGCFGTTTPIESTVDAATISNLSSLKAAIAQMRTDWATFQGFMSNDLLQRSLRAQRIYTAGSFTLQRFITDLSLKTENHIGEAIVREDGQLEYLKTYRLSEAQTRRVYLLSQLAANDWNLQLTADRLGNTLEEFVYRLEKAGFGYLLKTPLREKAAKQRRKSS